MAKAHYELQLAWQGKGILGKAADDEPVFILRGQDLLADGLVYLWASMAKQHGCPQEKVDEALRCAQAMSNWPNRKYPD